MEYEILTETPARVVIAGQVYRLEGDAAAVLAPRQAGLAAEGHYGELVATLRAAQVRLGLPPRFAWRGVVNSLGDHAAVLPPYDPTPAERWRVWRERERADYTAPGH